MKPAAWFATVLAVLSERAVAGADASPKPLARDEQVLWFPARATPVKNGWGVSSHGIVTEEEKRPVVS